LQWFKVYVDPSLGHLHQLEVDFFAGVLEEQQPPFPGSKVPQAIT
jgi:hypothetical protein